MIKALSLVTAFVLPATALFAQSGTIWSPANGGNGHYYQIVTTPNAISWTDAENAAKAQGGYLATITSADEDAFVTSLLPSNFANWIGGVQLAPDGSDWTWVTGETWNYTNWQTGEPNYPGYENWLTIYGYGSLGTGTWNNRANDAGGIYGYVIEYGAPDVAAPPMPTAAPSIANLPRTTSFYSDLPVTLNLHGSDFSPDAFKYLTNAANSTAPLTTPSSSKYFKAFAGNLSQSLKQVSSVFDILSTVFSVSKISHKILDISLNDIIMPIAIANIPAQQRNDVDAIWSAVDELYSGSEEFESYNPADAVSFAFSVNSYFLGHVLAPGADLFAQDPPDPDYQSLYVPHITYPAALPSTGNAQLDMALQQQTYATQAAAGYLEAVNKSFDKYGGAIQAGNNIYATYQMEAILNYLSLYNQSAQQSMSTIQATQQMLTSLGMAGGNYDPSQLSNLQDQVVLNGLPPDTVSSLSAMGLSTDQIQQVETSFEALDPQSYSGSLTDANSTAAATFFKASTATEQLTSIQKLANTHIALQFLGVANGVFTLEYTGDLKTAFAPLATVTADANGVIEYEDAAHATATQGFYRLALPSGLDPSASLAKSATKLRKPAFASEAKKVGR